jgi:urocanate hydratase
VSCAGDAEILFGEQKSGATTADREQIIEQLAVVEGFYWSLMQNAGSIEGAVGNAEPGLGGQLLYAGILDRMGCALATAGNVAGVATLAATANQDAQRKAVREGVVDFLVNSLDEALRILKNELRKREPVSVCVGQEPKEVESEMRERGVQPDLLGEIEGSLRGAELNRCETRSVRAEPVEAARTRLAWCVAEMPAQWMPKLDAMAMAQFAQSERATLRWLQHAQRYVSRESRGVRVLRCWPETAKEIIAQMRLLVESGSIGSPVWIVSRHSQAREEHAFYPPEAPLRTH